jgi:hypothetical protein
MASFKLNIARIRGCPAPAELLAQMQVFGLPETDEFGVLRCNATSDAVWATILRKTQQAVSQLNTETNELEAKPVERATAIPLAVRPKAELLEVYAGSAGSVEQAGVFFSSCLALPTVVEEIELDIPAALEKLAKTTQRFQLKGVRVSDYSHNSYMTGAYVPKFMDSEHGREFLEKYEAALQSADVRFHGPNGRVSVKLTPRACFSYSCHEDDQATVQQILRGLVGTFH